MTLLRLLLLCLLVPVAHAAGPGQRIQRIMESGNREKAHQVCGKLEEKGVVMGDAQAKALCAQVNFEYLRRTNPAEGTVERFARKWSNTPTSKLIITQLWERASQRNTIHDCQEFQRKWPATPEANLARNKEHQIAFSKARTANTVQSWKDLLEAYPAHPLAADAQTAWGEAAFHDAKREDTQAGWKRLIAEWPRHPRLQEMKNLLNAVAFRDARETNTVEGWRALLLSYPDHPQKLDAQAGLSEAGFARATLASTTAAWDTFLAEFPDHPRLEEAKALRMDTIYAAARTKGLAGIQEFAATYPTDPRAPLIRGFKLKDKITGKVRHPQGDLALDPEGTSLEAWHRNLEVRISGLRVSSVELLVIHKDNLNIVPYVSAWKEIVEAEGIHPTIFPAGPKIEWTRSGSTWKTQLPQLLCMPTKVGTTLVVAAHLSGTEQPTTLAMPVRPNLECSQLSFEGPRITNLKSALKRIGSASLNGVRTEGEWPLTVKKIDMSRDTILNGVPCDSEYYVTFDAAGYEDDDTAPWRCVLSTSWQPWGERRALPAGATVHFYGGTGYRRTFDFEEEGAPSRRYGKLLCSAGAQDSFGDLNSCDLAKAIKISGVDFQAGVSTVNMNEGLINTVHTNKAFRIGGITCIRGVAQVSRGRLVECYNEEHDI